MKYKFRGKYLPTNDYNKLDVVTFKKNDSDPVRFFLCITANTKLSPQEPNPNGDTEYWALLNADSDFPASVDSFIPRTNLQASEIESAKRYQALLLKPSRTPAEDDELNTLAQNLRNKIPLPEDWNKMQDSIQNMQFFIKDRVEGYLNSNQVEMENKKNEFISFVNDQSIAFNTKLNRFTDKGAYSGTVQYFQWNTVKYNDETYICIQDCIGKDPTDRTYWSKIAAKGDKGDQGLSGLGLVYRGSYDGTLTYKVQDAVNYGGSIYYCKKDAPIGVNPNDSNYWALFMAQQSIPISPTPPATPSEDDLWLDTTSINPLLKYWNGDSWVSAIAYILDNSVTDPKIGNRTIDPNISTTFSLTGTITQLLSWIGKYLTQITGKPLFQAPRTTLENAVKLDGDTMKGNMIVDVGGVTVNGSSGSWGTVNWRIALRLAAAGIIFWPKGTGTRSIGIGKTNDDLLRIMSNTTEDNTTTVENLILVDAGKKVTFFNGDVDVSGGVNTQLKVQKSGKDSNGVFTTIDYRRQNNSLFLRCVLSNPDANGNYQTDTWTFYQADGKAAEETRVYTLTYDADGDLVSATY